MSAEDRRRAEEAGRRAEAEFLRRRCALLERWLASGRLSESAAELAREQIAEAVSALAALGAARHPPTPVGGTDGRPQTTPV